MVVSCKDKEEISYDGQGTQMQVFYKNKPHYSKLHI